MKQTIDYSTLQEPEKSKKAINDAKFYLGLKPFKALTEIMSTLNDEKGCTVALAMGGIVGFPAKAMIAKYMGTKLKKDEKL
jgi:hypothetical protein